MPLRVCIIPDKFKGSLTAREAGQAMAQGWRSARPDDEVQILPMSDGGDGFGEVLGGLMGASPQTCKTVDASHHPVQASWWLHPPSGQAVVESAQVIGLAMLPPGKFHPFELDTFGLGCLLKEAAARGASRCLVGIGGSATNDGGMGMARALGWQFQNHRGGIIDRWTDLHTLHQVHPPESSRIFQEMTVAVDVTNPLLGPQGCSRIFGPQKGLLAEDFEFAERCLGTLARVMADQGYSRHASSPGAGAAGGLGYGLLSFCGATLRNGFELFAAQARLEEVLQQTQVVLTSEGALDQQTLMGKGVGEVARRCQSHGVPCLAFAGQVEDPPKARLLFTQTHALTPDFTSLEESMNRPGPNLTALVARVARAYSPVPTSVAG